MTKISPSVLSANFAAMGEAVKLMEEAGADYLHCDVMDGIFVPNITFGFKMIEDMRALTSLPLDVHLMISQPERYIDRFIAAGSDIITIHVEATVHVQRVVAAIKSQGVKAGVVLNPATSLDTVKYVLDDVDMILLMSVNPGYGGQKFIPQVKGKISELRAMLDACGREIEIEVDGGITTQNAAEIAAAGADVLVAGNAVFTGDARQNIKLLKG